MNRQQAKAVVELGLDKLKEIGYQNIGGIEKNWHVVKAFSEGSRVRYRGGDGGSWSIKKAGDDCRFYESAEYEVAPETFKIGDEEFKKPTLREAIEDQIVVYMLSASAKKGYVSCYTTPVSSQSLKNAISRNSLFLSKADAQRAVEAMGWEI